MRSPDHPRDDRRDCFTCGGGKADAVGIETGSCEASGVLAVANSLSRDQLDGEVGLDRRAAANIVQARPFDSLEALDDVPWIGANAFDSLLDWARANGYVDSACLDRCGTIESVFDEGLTLGAMSVEEVETELVEQGRYDGRADASMETLASEIRACCAAAHWFFCAQHDRYTLMIAYGVALTDGLGNRGPAHYRFYDEDGLVILTRDNEL